MNTEEALRVVESVLNEYRAVSRMAEVLDNVMQAEIVAAELGQQADGLRKEIADLESEKAATKKKVADAGKVARDSHAVNMAKMLAVEDSKWKDIKEAEIRLEGLRNMAAEMEKSQAEAASAAKERLDTVEASVSAAANRLAQIEAKIAELKGI